ncbi:DUF3883 domain-containing protein [Algiphilus sp.]|uniref:DUF3883 domain-containing protein n=1 Tax=Algiphilus sp. TaxID=1872431 RepID=UPI0025C1C5F4|nr:DUF3883 domain-containing protein [Algiphilus sp.]MCK5769064.1 DUF3883 domain-containing protein [Algiphilus sp.]
MAEVSPWTREEVEAVVADYLHMLTLELSSQHYVKAQHRQRLKGLLQGRSDGSIERKHQNISAVMLELGCPYVPGYKPLSNYQRLLFDVVAERLAMDRDLDASAEAAAKQPAIKPLEPDFKSLLADAPESTEMGVREQPPEYAGRRQAVKRDYLALEASNRSLGKAGEELVVSYEHHRLHRAGKRRLSERVEHVAATRGDGLGYDVLSFDLDGRERLIEVKTTAFAKETPFFLSRNELALSRQEADAFHLYRVFAFRRRPQLFDLPGRLEDRCQLDPVSYLARF